MAEEGTNVESPKNRQFPRGRRFIVLAVLLLFLIPSSYIALGYLCRHHCWGLCLPPLPTESTIQVISLPPTPDDPQKAKLGFVPDNEIHEGTHEERLSTGPASFAVSRGHLFIADPVRLRVAIFDTNTLAYHGEIPVSFPPERVTISDGKLLIRSRYGLSLSDEVFDIAKQELEPKPEGVWTRDFIHQRGDEEREIVTQFPLPHEPINGRAVISARAFGRDAKGDTFVVTQSRLGTRATVETIMKYSPNGQLLLESPPTPDGQNDLEVIDRVAVDEDGTCYVLTVKRSEAKVWSWKSAKEQGWLGRIFY